MLSIKKTAGILIVLACFATCIGVPAECENYYIPYSIDGNQNEPHITLYEEYEDVQFVTETYLSIIFVDKTTNHYGFIDKNSNSYHCAEYLNIYDLFCRDPTCPILVETDSEELVYVDRITGEIILNGAYVLFGEESEFRNGFALVYIYGKSYDYPSLIDRNGRTINFPERIIPLGSVQDNGLLIIGMVNEEDDILYGICNSSGQIIVYPLYDLILEYCNGFTIAKAGGNLVLIDESGCRISEWHDLDEE